MDDPRTEFQAGKDRQVIVVFEWQGPAGHHQCEGIWKDPSGRDVFTSRTEVDARTTRFTVYWGLSLPDAVATGMWVVEAQVDGEPAGMHAFQIKGDAAAASHGPRALSVAELYKLGGTMTLSLEVVDAKGKPLDMASGFLLEPDLVLTSFSGLNAAHLVRLKGGGSSLETGTVVAWNRHDDWAMLRLPAAAGPPAARANRPLQVGDRCLFLDAQGEAGRVIIDTTVIGLAPNGSLTLANAAGEASLGGPVLNEHGEVAAYLAGDRVAGMNSLDAVSMFQLHAPMPRGLRALPVPAIPPSAATTTLDDLMQQGVFVRPLVYTPHFVSGVMGSAILYQGKVPMASDQRFVFGRGEKECLVFMTWTPAQQEDAVLAFEMFDADNRKLVRSPERKVKLRVGETHVQWWPIELARLRPGVYRIDVSKNGDPVWRTYFEVTE